ncbi:MAG: DNA-binding protein WhiA [Clostridia bacterium]|nr:DNA-binding protein WhiA [Clostridia bacterium]
MSFSKKIKQELSKLNNLANKEIVKAELIGYLITNNIKIQKHKIKFSTESEYNINRFAKLLSNLGIDNYEISIQGKNFCIEMHKAIELKETTLSDNTLVLNNEINTLCSNEILEKAIVRGSFLGSGSINNPEKIYHLEINYSNNHNACYILEILNKYNINIKKMNNTLYLKDGEEISKLLAFMGANSSVLKFEEIRVIRDMRNNVNRLVNCETANINKTINAALKQIEDIKLIKQMNKFNELPPNVQELANIRLENPEISLVELGTLLSTPVGKSGVNYRMKVISNLAQELRKNS